jgi:hypothetical protein
MSLRAWIAGTLILTAVGVGLAADPETSRPDVRWEKQRLSVRVERVGLGTLIGEILQKTGAALRGQPLVEKDVSLVFEPLPLEEALHRVLGEQNFTVRYGPTGQPLTIELLGGPEAPVVAAGVPPPSAGAPIDRPALPPRLGFPRTFPSRKALDLPEVLQKAAGAKTATFDQAFDLATLNQEGLTRAMASQVVLSQLERDRRTRRALLSAVAKFDDETLRSFQGTVEGERVRDLLMFLSAHSREPSLQRKAEIALDRLTDASR